MRRSWLLFAMLAGCDEGTSSSLEGTADAAVLADSAGDRGATDAAPTCLPSKTAWEAEQRPRVEAWCGACHGEVPSFGAPQSLLDYDALVAGPEGTRLVDQLVTRLKNDTMPPAAQPQPPHGDAAALVEWATCGAQTLEMVPNPIDTGADRPVLQDPGGPPEGTEFFDLLAPEFPIGEDWGDHYECFSFVAPVDEERFIRRIETIIDDARVLHHTVLVPKITRAPGEHGPCESDNPLELIYAWAPGQGALHFPEGGLRLAPGQGLTLQIHYNNRAGHRGVRDASGVRVYHGPPEGPEVGMLALGPLQFEVPARGRSTATGWCRLPADTKMIASFPHMHELGTAFDQVVERASGATETVIQLDTWDFNAQYIYDTPVELAAGDVVRTTCSFANEGDRPVGFGGGTDDEMCFNFAYVTPPVEETGLNFCNSGAPAPEVPPYAPGECAPVGADAVEVAQVRAELRVGTVPPPEGGVLPEGLFMLSGGVLYVPTLRLGPISVDADATVLTAQGLLSLIDGQASLDAQVALHLVTSASDFDENIEVSLGAAVSPRAANPAYLDLAVSCGNGELADSVRYTVTGDRLTLFIGVPVGPITLHVELWFDPIP